MEKKTVTKKEKVPAKQKTEPKKTVKQAKRKELFTKDSTLGAVIIKKPEAQVILLGFGMHCFGCPVTQFETLEEAAMVHGVELKLLLKKLNEN